MNRRRRVHQDVEQLLRADRQRQRDACQHTGRVRAVVAIGEAVGDVEAAFAGASPVVTATSMDEAVARAGDLARPGDVVLLAPGCASFDWYRSYGERGDDFARAVRARIGGGR